jgi:cellulose synthase (UDP-forming)
MIVRRPVSDTSHLPEQADVSKGLLLANLVLAGVYFVAIAFWFPHGNTTVFVVFLLGEVFHLWQLGTYLYTVWGPAPAHDFDHALQPSVDIFITVAGEPVDLVAQTVRGALRQDYAGEFAVVVLNDGLVAGKEDWRDIEQMAARLGVTCITRTEPGGAKAGNVNHALRQRSATLVAILDADHVPEPHFLSRTVGHFVDERLGFVQSPQYYANHGKNYVTGGAWEQQDLFFGPILAGKDRTGSAFMCGTNVVIRRTALDEVGGLCQTNIAEDFLTSLLMHERGWKSVYVPEVLAQGLAPEDFLSYYKQQHRWARGSLEVIFKYNPLFRRGLSWAQRVQYLASASYYLTGVVVLMNAVLPLLFFFAGLKVFDISTNALSAVFIPYICLSLYVLQRSSAYSYTFRALAFSTGSFWLQITALAAVLTGRKTTFAVTSKQQLTGSFLHLVSPHLVYVAATAIGLAVAVSRDGVTASVVTNGAWALLTCVLFLPTIRAAAPARSRAVPVAGQRPQLVAVQDAA